MSRIIIAAAIIVGLTACQKKAVDEHNASVGQVANAVAAARQEVRFNPGRWESTVKVLDVQAPDMPPQAVAMMKSAMGNASGRTAAACLTKEQAAKPNATFFNNADKSCVFDHYTMGGGTIDAAMRCGPDPAHKAEVSMKGTYAPDHYAMDMTSATTGPTGKIDIHMAIDSKRVGDCNGTE